MGHLCNYPHIPPHVSLPQPGPQEGTQRFVGWDAQKRLSMRLCPCASEPTPPASADAQPAGGWQEL